MTVTQGSPDYLAWDKNIGAERNASVFLQSSFWGEFLLECELAIPIYLSAKIDDKPVGSMLIIHRNILPKKYTFLRKIPYIFDRLEIQQGPVNFDSVNQKESLIAFLEWIDKYKKNNKIGEINFDSYAPSLNLCEVKDLMRDYGYTPQPWATYYVDLLASNEEIFTNIDRSARKGVNKALREGILVRKVDTWNDFEKSYLLPYIALKGCAPEVYENHKKLWKNNKSSEYYSFFVCEDSDGQLLGMLGIFIFLGVATEIASGVTSLGLAKKVPVQDLLHWQIMIHAKTRGCRLFDLAGVSPNPKTAKESNILRFKKKWGGTYVEYDTFYWRHTLVELARCLNNYLKKLKMLLT